MSISRREFLLGFTSTASGLIVPSWTQRAMEYLDRSGKPMIERIDNPRIILQAAGIGFDDMDYVLSIGDYEARPPEMTLGQFFRRFDLDPEEHFPDEVCDELLDSLVDWDNEYYDEYWYRHESGSVRAFHLLDKLDIGFEWDDDESDERLILDHDSSMVSEWWRAGTPDQLSISFLQRRLTEMKTGIQIEMAS